MEVDKEHLLELWLSFALRRLILPCFSGVATDPLAHGHVSYFLAFDILLFLDYALILLPFSAAAFAVVLIVHALAPILERLERRLVGVLFEVLVHAFCRRRELGQLVNRFSPLVFGFEASVWIKLVLFVRKTEAAFVLVKLGLDRTGLVAATQLDGPKPVVQVVAVTLDAGSNFDDVLEFCPQVQFLASLLRLE